MTRLSKDQLDEICKKLRESANKLNASNLQHVAIKSAETIGEEAAELFFPPLRLIFEIVGIGMEAYEEINIEHRIAGLESTIGTLTSAQHEADNKGDVDLSREIKDGIDAAERLLAHARHVRDEGVEAAVFKALI